VTARGRISWVLFEWARNPYVLVITIYVYATYFTRDIVGDPCVGRRCGPRSRVMPGLWSRYRRRSSVRIADAGGRRKPWVAFFCDSSGHFYRCTMVRHAGR